MLCRCYLSFQILVCATNTIAHIILKLRTRTTPSFCQSRSSNGWAAKWLSEGRRCLQMFFFWVANLSELLLLALRVLCWLRLVFKHFYGAAAAFKHLKKWFQALTQEVPGSIPLLVATVHIVFQWVPLGQIGIRWRWVVDWTSSRDPDKHNTEQHSVGQDVVRLCLVSFPKHASAWRVLTAI